MNTAELFRGTDPALAPTNLIGSSSQNIESIIETHMKVKTLCNFVVASHRIPVPMHVCSLN